MSQIFTDDENAAIIACRERGLSWCNVAKAIHRHPGDVRRHGSGCLGLVVTLPVVLSVRPKSVYERRYRASIKARELMAPEDRQGIADDRAPLWSGHPTTWGAICSMPYPAYQAWRASDG